MQHMNVVCVCVGGGCFCASVCIGYMCGFVCAFLPFHSFTFPFSVYYCSIIFVNSKKKQVNKGTKVFKCVVWGGLKP